MCYEKPSSKLKAIEIVYYKKTLKVEINKVRELPNSQFATLLFKRQIYAGI